MQGLATLLQEAEDAPIKLIASDGVFSMDGSITPLKCVRVCPYPAGMHGLHFDAGKCVNLQTNTRRWSSWTSVTPQDFLGTLAGREGVR